MELPRDLSTVSSCVAVLLAVLRSTSTLVERYARSKRRCRGRIRSLWALLNRLQSDPLLLGQGPRQVTHLRRMAMGAVLGSAPTPRHQWVYPISTNWWKDLLTGEWGDEKWLENFRMTKKTLFDIADLLRPTLQRQLTVMRQPISVEKRVAIAVWWLATMASYREVAHHFGVGRSTVGAIVLEVCFAIEHVLLKDVICLGEYQKIMDGFGQMGFPHCVGAIDDCRVPICAPTGQGYEYTSHKEMLSFFLQGTVDHSGRFTNIEVGWSGKNHEDFTFGMSSICEAMDSGAFVPSNPTIMLGGVLIPPLILADEAYPMRAWLMKPFEGHLDRRKLTFNCIFNHCRVVVERAFARLKARWRCLTARLPVAEENVASVISACAVLHNICEARGHVLSCSLLAQEYLVIPHRKTVEPKDDQNLLEGKCVRDAIADFLLEVH
ncbi:uncharacterized protein PHA67_002021 [Liasis olivaceus]